MEYCCIFKNRLQNIRGMNYIYVCVYIYTHTYHCFSPSGRIINDFSFFLISLYISIFPTVNLVFENR